RRRYKLFSDMLFLIIIILSFLLQLFLPWWVICAVAFGAAFWKAKNTGHAFGSAFFAIFTLWIAVALFYTIPNGNILANRIGAMLSLPDTTINWVIVLLLSGVIGGLAAAFCGLAGYYIRTAFILEEKSEL